MKKQISLACSVAIFAGSLSALAAAHEKSWVEELRKDLAPLGRKGSLSIAGMNGEKILDINESNPMVPASIAKIISTGCSLESLTPGFQFKTEFLTVGKIRDGKLSAPLIVRGAGDPSFVIEDLREQIARLRSLYRINSLEGPLQIDTSFMEKPTLSINDSFDGDEGRAFTADLTALLFNYNAFSVWIASSPNENKALVEVFPSQALDLSLDASGVKIKSGSGSPGNGDVSYDQKKGKIVVSGSFSPESLPKALYRSVPDPYRYFYETFKAVWLQSGGQWTNPSYELIKNSGKAALLVRHESRALSSIVRDINKSSLNLSAEMVLLAAAGEKYGWPTSREKASKLIAECIDKHGISKTDIQLDNASGLSKNARIKTSAFTSFLKSYLRSEASPDFIASLPVLGQDGTVKSRFKEFQGRARVKTGTLKDVASLSGIVFPEKGQPMLFTFVINGLPGFSPEAQKYEKIVIESMLRQ